MQTASKAHSPQHNVLLVEDDAPLAASLLQGLKENDFPAVWAASIRLARECLPQEAFDIIILDLGLPDGDGIDLLHEIRQSRPKAPILILTARDEVSDRVKGLDAGADDYLTKPFAFSELVARLRALCRRGETIAEPVTTLAVGNLSIDLLQRRVQRGGTEIILSPLEFDVLVFLVNKAGTTVSRETLTREVWKITSRASPMNNVIDVLMTRLREKVDRDFACPLLRTIRGVGYKCEEPAT
jgi:two-component system, OmpR family, copper resistance phosphate regulon response regulator CusR